ncbi:MAG: hypothetical protein AB7O91_05250 [Sphingomonas sp.]
MSGYLNTPSMLSGWRLAVGIAVAFIFLLGMCSRGRVTGADIARDLDADPNAAIMAMAMRTHYPQDFETILLRLADVANNSPRQAVAQAAAREFSLFLQGKAGTVANAPNAELRALAAATLGFITELRSGDVNLCAQYALGGVQPGQQLPVRARPLQAQLVSLQLAAARQAETSRRVSRPALSPADGRRLFERISVNAPNLAPLIDNGSIERAPASQQCEAGVAIYRSITELPDPVAANVMAQILRDATRPAQPQSGASRS